MKSLWMLLAIVAGAVFGSASAQEVARETPPVSPELQDYRQMWDMLVGRPAQAKPLLPLLMKRASGLSDTERNAPREQLHLAVRQSLKVKSPVRVFGPDGAVLKGFVGLIEALGDSLTAADVLHALPTPGAKDEFRWSDLQSGAFLDFAKTRWSKECSDRVFVGLADPGVVDKPTRFLALTRLAVHAAPAERAAVEAAFQNLLNRPNGVAETRLVELFEEIQSWDHPGETVFRNWGLKSIASQLYRQPTLDLADSVSDDTYLEIAEYRPPATDWSLKVARQFQDRNRRNDRALRLLVGIVAAPGDHFTPIKDLIAKDADADLFVYLHRTSPHVPALWPLFTSEDAKVMKETVTLLKDLFHQKNQKRWSGDLLELTVRDYYRHEPAFFRNEVFLPLASDDSLRDNEIRQTLLGYLAANKIPCSSADRWELAMAAGKRPLRTPLSWRKWPNATNGPSEIRAGDAIEFLAAVCVDLELPEDPKVRAKLVNDAYGDVLDHAFTRLFQTQPTDDAVENVRELNAVLGKLGDIARSDRIRSDQLPRLSKFVERTRERFQEIVRRPKRDDDWRRSLVSLTQLNLRLSALLRDPEPVKMLARETAKHVFKIVEPSKGRKLPPAELTLQAEMLKELSPVFTDSLRWLQMDLRDNQELRSTLIQTLEDDLYHPLLATHGLLERVGGGPHSPWLKVIELYEPLELRQNRCEAIQARLGALEHLGAQRALRDLLPRLWTIRGLQFWKDAKAWTTNANLTLPLYKDILDDFGVRLPDAKPDARDLQVVVEKFLDGLTRREAWTQSSAEANAATPQNVLPFLARIVVLHESLAARFTQPGQPAFDPFAPAAFRYWAPKQAKFSGPEFELPNGPWSRANVPAGLRLRLIDAHEKHRPTDVIGRADLVMFLPSLELQDSSNLGRAIGEKRTAMGAELDRLLSRKSGDVSVDRLTLLKTAMRLRYSHGTTLPAPSSEFVAALNAASPVERKALFYEDAMLDSGRKSQGRDRRGRMDYLLKNFMSELGVDGELGTDKQNHTRQLKLGLRGAGRHEYLRLIGESDVLTYWLLWNVLDDDASNVLGAEGRPRHEAARDVLFAYALTFPFYHCQPDDVLTNGDAARGVNAIRDRLVLFQLCNRKIKTLLKDTVLEGKFSPVAAEHVRRLLMHHNYLVLGLAEGTFNDPNLLVEVCKESPYSFDLCDFQILHRYQKDVSLTAKGLFDDAFQAISDNFDLALCDPGGPGSQWDDLEATSLAFLFDGVRGFELSATEARGPWTSTSFDNVVRRVLRIAHDPRYDAFVDANVRSAAQSFRKRAIEQAAKFELPLDRWRWTSKSKGKISNGPPPRASFYLRVCERAAERVREWQWNGWELPAHASGRPEHRLEKLKTWQESVHRDYAKTWQTLLFGATDAPPTWSTAFVKAICRGDRPSQLNAFETAVTGEQATGADVKNEAKALEGLRRSLAHWGKLEAGSRAEQFHAAYFKSVQRVFGMAQLGIDKDGKPVAEEYLAKPYLRDASSVRPLTSGEVDSMKENPADSPYFADVTLLDRWDRQFPEPALQSLLGKSWQDRLAERKSPGLGGSASKPTDFRSALWGSWSEYAAAQMKIEIDALGRIQKESRVASPRDWWTSLQRGEDQVLEATTKLIAFRLRHVNRLKYWAEISAPGSQTRLETWRWLQIDETTVCWARIKASFEGPFHELAPIWAPFGVYAQLDDLTVSGLGLEPGAWERRSDLKTRALLYLASLLERDAPEGTFRLRPDVDKRYSERHASSPWIVQPVHGRPDKSIREIGAWIDLDAWAALPAARERRRHLSYEYSVIPKHRVAETLEALDRVDNRTLGKALFRASAAFANGSDDDVRAAMLERMSLLEHGVAAGPRAFANGAEPTSALALALSASAWSFPVATPFGADSKQAGKARFIRHLPSWSIEDLKKLGFDSDRRKVLGLVCVLQLEEANGDLRPVPAGYMGYFDYVVGR